MTDNNPPKLIGNRYQVIDELGHGGMGAVYRVRDRLTNDVVALKRVIIDTQVANSDETVQELNLRLSLAREFRMLASLRHPHVIKVLDYGFDRDRQPYFTMELLTGSQTILEAGWQDDDFFAELGLIIDLLQALAYLHRRDILHRDLKPANVLVSVDGTVKVLDFGLAIQGSVEEPDEIAGTLAYMAPELFQGIPPSRSSDLFAVGVMLYQLLTHHHPFGADGLTLSELISRLLTDSPDTLRLEERIEQVIFDMQSLTDDDNIFEASNLDGPTRLIDPNIVDQIAKEEASRYTSDEDKTIMGIEFPSDVDEKTQLLDAQDIPVMDEEGPTKLGGPRDDAISPLDGATQLIDMVDLPVVDDESPTIIGIRRPSADSDDSDFDDETQVFGGSDVTEIHQADVTRRHESGEMPMVDLDDDSSVLTSQGNTLYSLVNVVNRLMTKALDQRYDFAYDVIADMTRAMGRTIPEESAAVRESFLQAASFVGRDDELQKLETALMSMRQGQGSIWLISGESGVGKSRLLDEIRIRAVVEGVLVLRGQNVASGGSAYSMWTEPLRRLLLGTDVDDLQASILRDILPEIDVLLEREIPTVVKLEGNANRERLFATIAQLFQQLDVPILVLLEDLQWSGQGLELINTLNSVISRNKLMIVGTFRSDEAPDLHEQLPGTNLLKLERLAENDVAILSESMIGEIGRSKDIVNFLLRETGGNVYFMVEVVRALADVAGRLDRVGTIELPASIFTGGVAAVLKQRLERIPASMRGLLRLSAIYGREIDLKLLKSLSDSENAVDEWLTVCANYAVIEVDDSQWHFAHDRLRLTILDELDKGQTIDLHRQVAEGIEITYSQQLEEYSARLAVHWNQAKDSEKTYHYALMAGDYALRISDFASALSHYEEALVLLPVVIGEKDQRQLSTASLRTKIGTTLLYMDRYDSALDNLKSALRTYQNLGEEALQGQVLSLMADVLWRQGEYEVATQRCDESLAITRKHDDRLWSARALNRKGMIRYEQGDYIQSNEFLQEALITLVAVKSEADEAGVLNNLGIVAIARGDYDQALAYLNKTLEMAKASGERWRVASTLINIGVVYGEQDDLDKAAEYFELSLEICRDTGNSRYLAFNLRNLGVIAEMNNRLDEALAFQEEGLALSQSIGNKQGSAEILLSMGTLAKTQNDPIKAMDYYRQSLLIFSEIDVPAGILDVIVSMARLLPIAVYAVKWLNLVKNHPATHDSTRKKAESELQKYDVVDDTSPVEEDLSAVVEEVLAFIDSM